MNVCLFRFTADIWNSLKGLNKAAKVALKANQSPKTPMLKSPTLLKQEKMFKTSSNTLKLRTCVLWLTHPNKVLLDQEKNTKTAVSKTLKIRFHKGLFKNNGRCHGDYICLLYSVWAAVFIWGHCILSLHFNSIDIGPNDNRRFIL